MAARDSTRVIHEAVRAAILSGELEPGSTLPHAQLAQRFGVSRGPVREALRLLEHEGLIEAEVNLRPRVAPLSIDDLEELYGVRIVTEALAIAITVPCLSDADLVCISATLDRLDELTGVDVRAWEDQHRRFHAQLVQHAGARVRRTLDQYYDHAERYRRMYIAGDPRAWSVGAAEHRQILEACLNRDAHLAAAQLARHLARSAITAAMIIRPDHEPSRIRAAVRQVTGPGEDGRGIPRRADRVAQ